MRRAMQYMMTPAPGQGNMAPTRSTSNGTGGGAYGEDVQQQQQKLTKEEAAAKRVAAKQKKREYKEKQKAEMSKKAETSLPEDGGYVDLAARRRAHEGELNEEVERFKKLSADQSKYYGGQEHTHFVKGLDEMLLQDARKKMDREREKAPKEGSSMKEQIVRDRTEKQQVVKSALAQRVESAVIKSLHPDQIGFRQNLNAMHSRLYKGDRVKSGPVAFLPMRTFYTFPTDLWDLEEKPVYGTRSKDECPPLDERRKCEYIERRLLTHLRDTMAEVRQTRKQRRADPQAFLAANPGARYNPNGASSSSSSSKAGHYSGAGSASIASGTRTSTKQVVAKGDDIFGDTMSFDAVLQKNAKKMAAAAPGAKIGSTRGIKIGSTAHSQALQRRRARSDNSSSSSSSSSSEEDDLFPKNKTGNQKSSNGTSSKAKKGNFFDQLDNDERGGSNIFESADDDFIATSSWRGAKRGWVFTTRERGTGYYYDYAAKDTIGGLAEQLQQRRLDAKARLAARGDVFGTSGDAYEDLSAAGIKYKHTKESMAQMQQAEDEFEKLTKKKQLKLQKRAEAETTDGAKFFGGRNNEPGSGNDRKFKTVDQELKLLQKMKEKGNVRRFDDMENTGGGSSSSKRPKLF
ncbi:unnamed protein product [Amoebophrya sp. A25]|nr:unnamed protein product [Amoebophrya sp. A25]|eukprot:GSA25T00005458001.1